MKPNPLREPSVEASNSTGRQVLRHSLYDAREDFIQRVAPMGMAAIYFGHFSLGPQDAALSRQALFKLSFLYRHFLKPAGLSILVKRQIAILSGTVEGRWLPQMGDLLAQQIDGICQVKLEIESRTKSSPTQEIRERAQLLFVTDQTVRSGVQVQVADSRLVLSGAVATPVQKAWAEQLAASAGAEVQSKLEVDPALAAAGLPSTQIDMDDESLQALVLFRLQLTRETEHIPVKVKAHRGIVSIHGKVRTEALRQRLENVTRSTLGLRELRSTITIAG